MSRRLQIGCRQRTKPVVVQRVVGLLIVSLFTGALSAHAQQIPIHALVAQPSPDGLVFGAIADVRAFANGTVLVNDPRRRRVVRLDADLKLISVVFDSTGPQSYGSRPGTLLRFPGDSAMFVDMTSSAMILIDSSGRVGRSIAPPRSGDLRWITSTQYGRAQIDDRGRLYYGARRPMPPGATTVPRDTTGKPNITMLPDSAPILRADFDTRSVDTVALFKVPVQKSINVEQGGVQTGTTVFNPIPTTDGWAVLSDGTIAIARAQDYHIDWIMPDGSRRSSPKMPFAWRPLTQKDKERVIDSVKTLEAEARAKAPPSPPRMIGGRPVPILPFVTVEPAELADFYPPIRAGQVFADAESNLWILPSTSEFVSLESAVTGGLVYDVVNRNGVVVKRIRLPKGRNIVGFGPRVVFLSYAISDTVTGLEKAIVPK